LFFSYEAAHPLPLLFLLLLLLLPGTMNHGGVTVITVTGTMKKKWTVCPSVQL
jgi:hypothetical protein